MRINISFSHHRVVAFLPEPDRERWLDRVESEGLSVKALRRAVRKLLEDEEWSRWSDREIAKRCHVTHPFVSAIRSECAPPSGKRFQTPRDTRKVSRGGTTYEMQAQDETLMDTATRIRARAIRRCGELLKQIESQQGGDRRSKGRQRPNGRGAAASDAGLSERQRKDALRVANVPKAEFESRGRIEQFRAGQSASLVSSCTLLRSGVS